MKKNILVVDDEQSIREVIQNLLEFKGYKVTIAEDGQNALDILQKEAFDLILTDISMPRLNGYELIKGIKKIQPLSVIIVLTGFSSIDGAVKAMHMGAYQYLSKPIKTAELFEIVEKGLQYSEDLYGPLQKTFEPGEETIRKGEPIMLHGFTPDEKMDFFELGQTRRYEAGETIATVEPKSSVIYMVEEGEVSIWLNNTTIDYLNKFDTWGDDSFVLAGSVPVILRAESPVIMQIFDRKRILDYFSYKGEKLLKRFMINLASSTFYKWRKSIQRIVMLKLISGKDE